MRRLAVVACVLALGWPGAGDGAERCIRQTRYWGGDGRAEHLVVVGGHAFFGGTTLRVAELDDPAEPVVVHEVRLDRPAAGVAADDHGVYVVDGGPEMVLIDASVPYDAAIVGRFVPDDPIWQLDLIDVRDGLAAAAGRTTWSIPMTTTNLMLVDVSGGPGDPALLGSIQLDGVVESLAVGRRTAVAATRNDRISFVDVGDPSAPVLAASIEVGGLLVTGAVASVDASGDLLAIGDTAGRVTLMDISDPGSPRYLSLVQGLDIGVVDLAIDGSVVHAVGTSCTQLGACGGYALIDILNPRSPALVGRFAGPSMASPAPVGGHVLAAAFKAGMRVVDLGGLTNPTLLDVVFPVRVAGPVASAGDLVHVVDVTTLADPDEPLRTTLRVLRRAPDGGLSEAAGVHPDGAIWALAADGDYVAAAIFDEAAGFYSVRVFDVSHPTAPVVGTRLGAEPSRDPETAAPHLAVLDDRMLLSLEGSDHILIYELAPGGRATQVGTYRPGGELLSFAAGSRDVLSVAVRDGDAGWIEVVDTRAPRAPFLAATITLPDPVDELVAVAADRHRLAVLGRDVDSFVGPITMSYLYDVADPANPDPVMDGLPGGDWVAIGAGIFHTIGDTLPPSGVRHHAVDVAAAPAAVSIESIGYLDVPRDRVDADGGFFTVSRSRLEVYDYGRCAPVAAVDRPPSFVD